MYLLPKIPGKRQAGSRYSFLSEFGHLADTGGSVTVLYMFYFSWLNSLMWKGYKKELKHEDLYATPEESLSQVLHKRFNKLVFIIYGMQVTFT